MAPTLPNGVVVPQEGGDVQISATGVAEMRALGASVDAQLATKADQSVVAGLATDLAAKASTEYVDAGIDSATWYRGNLTVAQAAETLPNGEYRVASGAVAQALGLPMDHHGVLQTVTNAAMTWGAQTYDTIFGVRWSRRIVSGAWSNWETFELPDPDMSKIENQEIRSGSLNDYFEPEQGGFYAVLSSNVDGTPFPGVLGFLENLPMTNSTVQRFTAYNGPEPRAMFIRTRNNAGVIAPWEPVSKDTPAPPPSSDAITSSRGVITQGQALAVLHAHLLRVTDGPVPIVYAGSSTTRGQGATAPEYRYTNRLNTFLQGKYPGGSTDTDVQVRTGGDPWSPYSGPGVHGYSIGRGGTQADTYLLDSDTANIAALDPAMIIHMVGSNDYARRRSLATYRADVEHRLDHLSAAIQVPHVHVLAHPYPRQDVSSPAHDWAEYGDVLRAIAANRPETVAFIDVSGAWEAVGVPGDDPFGYLDTDLIHIGDGGYAFLAHTMAIGLGEK